MIVPLVLDSLFLLQGTSQLRNRTGVSCIVGGFFTSWATREAIDLYKIILIITYFHTFFHCFPSKDIMTSPSTNSQDLHVNYVQTQIPNRKLFILSYLLFISFLALFLKFFLNFFRPRCIFLDNLTEKINGGKWHKVHSWNLLQNLLLRVRQMIWQAQSQCSQNSFYLPNVLKQ